MGDYYHQFLSSMTGIGANTNPNTQEGQPPTPPPGSVPFSSAPMPNPYQSLGYFTGFPEPVMYNAPKGQRSRRKSAPGLDHVKHRRTRSGCYTCRSRRVKCDETHPICERCKKGKRECVYPEPSGHKSSGGQGSKDSTQQTSPASSHEEDDDIDQDTKLDTILDEDEPDTDSPSQVAFTSRTIPRRASTISSLNLQKLDSATRHSSETPSLEGTKSSSPSVSTGTSSSMTPATHHFSDKLSQSSTLRPEWAHLPPDFRFYLSYFCDNITHYHYCMVQDPDDFYHTTLLDIALQNQPLLYAIIGFSAYHLTIQDPNGKIQEFLQYYNKSVTLLLSSLKRKEQHNPATLLTILQLATIEEYLGDWVNLMGHQKAAFEVLTRLFTPETAMQTATNRMILTWYVRFDVFVGLLGGLETALPRNWFTTTVHYCQTQLSHDPESLTWKVEDCSSRLRLISRDMSLLFAQHAMGSIPRETFVEEHQKLYDQLRTWKDGLDNALGDPAYLVTDFGTHGEPNVEDIVDPYCPGNLYDFPLFSTTILTCEWHSITIMHNSQGLKMVQSNPQGELAQLTSHAFAICQIFETVELWAAQPKGVLNIMEPCIAIATLFLPKDTKYHMWIRRKFALLEMKGYIFPLNMRIRMAELFRDQSCVRWWLPNDEGFSPTLQSVRTFADERNATAVSAQTENLREIKHIFEAMHIGSGPGISEDQLQGSSNTTKGKGRMS